jgi:flagellar protein FlaG
MDIRSIANSATAPVVADTPFVGSAAETTSAAGLPGNNVNARSGTREDVEAAVATIQDFVQSVSRSLNFSLEENSGQVIVKVTDSGSGDVIRQIPSEEALQLAENLSEVRSLLFKAEA